MSEPEAQEREGDRARLADAASDAKERFKQLAGHIHLNKLTGGIGFLLLTALVGAVLFFSRLPHYLAEHHINWWWAGLAALVAIPLGFLIGMSRVLHGALNPIIQVLRPVSPLAWMPLALYTIKDSSISAIFVIFICSIWPMLLNTAFGDTNVRREWLNVARTLEAGRLRTALAVILPAAAPTIMTGARISIGIAWLVIVAAEMLVGGTGIGYFVWNQWNNLSIADIVCAILIIGLVGTALDQALAALARIVAWQD